MSKEIKISDNLKEIMSARNLSGAKLSQLSGVAESTISRTLSGKVVPSSYNVMRMAKALNITSEQLLYGKGVSSEKHIQINEILTGAPLAMGIIISIFIILGLVFPIWHGSTALICYIFLLALGEAAGGLALIRVYYERGEIRFNGSKLGQEENCENESEKTGDVSR